MTVLTHPLALVILLASLAGLAVSARSLQVGKAVPVIAVTSAAANISHDRRRARSSSASRCPTTRWA